MVYFLFYFLEINNGKSPLSAIWEATDVRSFSVYMEKKGAHLTVPIDVKHII